MKNLGMLVTCSQSQRKSNVSRATIWIQANSRVALFKVIKLNLSHSQNKTQVFKDTRKNSIFIFEDFSIRLNSSFYFIERNPKIKRKSFTFLFLLLLFQISLPTKRRKIIGISVIKHRVLSMCKRANWVVYQFNIWHQLTKANKLVEILNSG